VCFAACRATLANDILHNTRVQTVARYKSIHRTEHTQHQTYTQQQLTIKMRHIEDICEVVAVPDPGLERSTHKEVPVVAQDGGVDVHRGRGVAPGAEALADL